MIENVDANSVNSITDYLEWYVLFNGREISKSKILRIIDGVKEKTVDSAFLELGNRLKLYGDFAHFIIKGNLIASKRKWTNYPELMICLIFSLKGARRLSQEKDGTKLFEKVSKEAIKGYLLGDAEVIGAPSTSNLKKQINNLCVKMNEKKGLRTPNAMDKDKGVDIVAWMPHGDGKPNQIVLLIQCAAGIHFRTKKPVPINAWREFIMWSVEPICGISIPHILDDKEFLDIRDCHGLVFDRIRIIKGIGKNLNMERGLRREILSWCRGKLANQK